ncbi:MAG: hypothetical protein U0172_03500 [Nitrospiraceae bacterium]
MNTRWINKALMAVAVLALASVAEAARVDVTAVTPVGPYPTLPVSANAMDFVWTACDPTNFDQFSHTGRELILVKNANVSTAKWVTFESVVNLGRTGDITQYSLGASEYAAFWAGNSVGWRQSGGKFYMKCEGTDIKYAIVRIPG